MSQGNRQIAKAVVFLASLLGAIALAFSSPEPISDSVGRLSPASLMVHGVKPGMLENRVRSLLGEANEVAFDGDSADWTYRMTDTRLILSRGQSETYAVVAVSGTSLTLNDRTVVSEGMKLERAMENLSPLGLPKLTEPQAVCGFSLSFFDLITGCLFREFSGSAVYPNGLEVYFDDGKVVGVSLQSTEP